MARCDQVQPLSPSMRNYQVETGSKPGLSERAAWQLANKLFKTHYLLVSELKLLLKNATTEDKMHTYHLRHALPNFSLFVERKAMLENTSSRLILVWLSSDVCLPSFLLTEGKRSVPTGSWYEFRPSPSPCQQG